MKLLVWMDLSTNQKSDSLTQQLKLWPQSWLLRILVPHPRPMAPQWFYEEKDVLDIEAKEKGKGLVYSKSLICVASLGAGDSRPLLRRMLPRT